MSEEQLKRFASRNQLAPEVVSELNSLVDSLVNTRLSDGSGASLLPQHNPNITTPIGTDETYPIGLLDTADDDASPIDLGDRYRFACLLGTGNMGEVYRVQDVHLERHVAMKVIRTNLSLDSQAALRFIQEARAIAQLEHPSIVPVYDLGFLPDGRYFFTMKEVHGRTFDQVITDVHAGDQEQGRTFRSLLDAMLKIAEAVAFAHARGVIHRDLKPANIVVGDFGEVLVVDWGLAKVLGDPTGTERPDIRTALHGGTLAGSIVGTPSYMPPEQASGQSDTHGPPSDVFSLGAILHEVLTGQSAYQGLTTEEVLQRVREHDIRLSLDDPSVPPVLGELCARAMAIQPGDRFEHAGHFAKVLSDYIQQAQQRERAMALLQEARRKRTDIARLRARADALREEVSLQRSFLAPMAAIELKRPIWNAEDQAARLEDGARVLDAMVTQLARGALQVVPELPEAHAFLANHYKAHHQLAELRRDPGSAGQFEMLLKAHDRGEHLAYLEGRGTLTLHVDADPTRVDIYRYARRDRRLVPEPWGFTQTAPLDRFELPMGSYLITLQAEGRLPIRYPVWIGRNEVWSGIPEGKYSPRVIHLPTPNELEHGEIWVPGGYAIRGGDEHATNATPRSVMWVDDFVIQAQPVTHREYLEFLNDLLRQGREPEALRYLPRGDPSLGASGNSTVGRDSSGRFGLLGGEGQLDMPIVLVDVLCATMYAWWLSARTGRDWALPDEDQWGKAARGVDGRAYPWGNEFDPTFACTREWGGYPVPITEFDGDESPYGVRGLGGNVRDWCKPFPHLLPDTELADDEEMHYAIRGGSCVDGPNDCRSATRHVAHPQWRSHYVGFRLVRSVG